MNKLFKRLLDHITSGRHFCPVPVKSFINQYGTEYSYEQIVQTAKEIKKRAKVSSLVCVTTGGKIIKYDYWALKDKIRKMKNRRIVLQEDENLVSFKNLWVTVRP